jgi:hypothetical protein
MTTKTKSRSKRANSKTTSNKRPAIRKTKATATPTEAAGSKQTQLIALLRRPDGASITEATEVLGWQAHSVRGIISGTIKKKLGLVVTTSKAEGGVRRYHVA